MYTLLFHTYFEWVFSKWLNDWNDWSLCEWNRDDFKTNSPENWQNW